jgi:hypothetical protein
MIIILFSLTIIISFFIINYLLSIASASTSSSTSTSTSTTTLRTPVYDVFQETKDALNLSNSQSLQTTRPL